MATKNKKKTAKKTATKKTAAKKPASKVTKISKAKSAKAKKSPAKKSAAGKKSSSAGSSGAKVISLSQARENRPAKVDWANFFTPVEDRVLLEMEKPADRAPGGLFIPDSAQAKSNHAKVLAVGPGKRDKKGRRKPLDVQVGEKVLFAEYAGSKLELAGRDLLLVSETDILGVLDR